MKEMKLNLKKMEKFSDNSLKFQIIRFDFRAKNIKL